VKVDFDEVEATLQAKPEPEGAGNTQRALDELVEDDVKEALDQLPVEFRIVTILSDVEGFSYKEIAEVLDCPIGTVRSRLSRARKFLQSKLYDFARRRGIVKPTQ
jgi:RNA polymerase sigma-70 factor (ECF subfamily)